jgi:hypothetical protein
LVTGHKGKTNFWGNPAILFWRHTRSCGLNMAIFTFLLEIWQLCPHFSCKRKTLRNKNNIKKILIFTGP